MARVASRLLELPGTKIWSSGYEPLDRPRGPILQGFYSTIYSENATKCSLLRAQCQLSEPHALPDLLQRLTDFVVVAGLQVLGVAKKPQQLQVAILPQVTSGIGGHDTYYRDEQNWDLLRSFATFSLATTELWIVNIQCWGEATCIFCSRCGGVFGAGSYPTSNLQ